MGVFSASYGVKYFSLTELCYNELQCYWCVREARSARRDMQYSLDWWEAVTESESGVEACCRLYHGGTIPGELLSLRLSADARSGDYRPRRRGGEHSKNYC